MNEEDLWVFGYGSLLWQAGFDAIEQVPATLHGHARTFCMRSYHYRGTPEQPGLVLALVACEDRKCEGLALRVENDQRSSVLSYLRKRELISFAYLECSVLIDLVDGRQASATTFVMDTSHEQYCGDLPTVEQARIIASAAGDRGSNAEYLNNTVTRLQELGINDPQLVTLNSMVRSIAEGSGKAGDASGHGRLDSSR